MVLLALVLLIIVLMVLVLTRKEWYSRPVKYRPDYYFRAPWLGIQQTYVSPNFVRY